MTAVLSQRARELHDELEMIKACGEQLSKPGMRFVNGYGKAVVSAAHDFVTDNLDFSKLSDEQIEGENLSAPLNIDAAE